MREELARIFFIIAGKKKKNTLSSSGGKGRNHSSPPAATHNSTIIAAALSPSRMNAAMRAPLLFPMLIINAAPVIVSSQLAAMGKVKITVKSPLNRPLLFSSIRYSCSDAQARRRSETSSDKSFMYLLFYFPLEDFTEEKSRMSSGSRLNRMLTAIGSTGWIASSSL